jgi:hypothetical protein
MLARACCVVFAALLAGSLAADESKPLAPKPRWRAGDAVRYDMTRTRAWEEDGQARKAVSHTPVDVEVADADEYGFVLRWAQGSTVYEDPKQEDPLDHATSAMQKLIDVDLDLGPDGALEGVRNWRDIRATGHKVQGAVLARMAKAGATKATLDAIRKQTDGFFASKESVERAFAGGAELLFLPFGREYDLGTALPYEARVPNPLGGDEPLPAKGEYALKSADATAGVAVIVFKQSLDAKEAAPVLREWLDASAKQAGKPAPKELPELQVDDVMEYEFDLSAGWVKSVTHTRTLKDGTRTRTETVTLTRKARPGE